MGGCCGTTPEFIRGAPPGDSGAESLSRHHRERKRGKIMYNDLLTIGPVTIHGYGLMTAMGILAAYFSAEYRAKKKGLDSSKVFGLVVCCVALGYVCSKALYLITVLPDILADPSIFWSSLANGWVVLGGILGGILGGWLYCRWRKLPTWNFFDVGMASVALAQGFGRIGCFLAGCC